MPDRKRRRNPKAGSSLDPLRGEEALWRLLGAKESVDAQPGDSGLLGGVDEANEDVDAFLQPEEPSE